MKLQKLNGPREADGDETNPHRRGTGRNESKAEKYDKRPKRVSAVFGNEIRERKKTRSPQQANPDNQYHRQRIYRSAPLNCNCCCAHFYWDGVEDN